MCMLKNDVVVFQKDHLPVWITCEVIKIQDGDLVLLKAEVEDVIWGSVHFPLNTVERYYIKEHEDKQ